MDQDYRRKILHKLKERNARINDGYSALVKSYNELLDFVVALKLKRTTVWSPGADRRNETGSISTEAEKNLLAQLQAELTEMYRRRSENAQQLIDANAKLQAKEAELASTSKTLKQRDDSVGALSEAKRNLEQRIEELTAVNQQLKDELLALQSTYGSLEEKYRRVNDENIQLVLKLSVYKEREAEIMNKEVDIQMKMQQLQLKTQLAEAAREQVLIVNPTEPFEPVDPVPHICIGATIPSRCKHKVEAHENPSEVFCAMWSPTGRYLGTGGGDRKVKLWAVEEGKCNTTATLTGCNKSVSCLDFDAEELNIMAGNFDFTIRTWGLNDQRLRIQLAGHSEKVMAAKFAGSGAKVVSGSHDCTIKLWDLKTRSCIQTFFPGSRCNDVAVVGANILSGHFDKKLRFYDARVPDHPVRDFVFDGKITSLDMANDKVNLLICTRDDVLHYFDLRANRIANSYRSDSFKIGFDYTRAVLSPDAQFCACGSVDGQLFIWNVLTGKLEKILGKPSNVGIIACTWHPKGQMIATSDRQRTVAIWGD